MKNDFNRNAISRTGYVTDKLRSDIERYILENQMVTFCIIDFSNNLCQLSHYREIVIY